MTKQGILNMESNWKEQLKLSPFFKFLAGPMGYGRGFNRLDLVENQTGSKEVSFKKLPNKFIRLEENQVPDLSTANSVAGWVPYFKGVTNVVFWHFKSVYYAIRHPLLVRVTLIDGLNAVERVYFSMPTYGVHELELKEYFGEKSGTSVAVEFFHPRIRKGHGGHDGHLRYWGKYLKDDQYSATVHSMHLGNSRKYLKKGNFGRMLEPINIGRPRACSISEIVTLEESQPRYSGYNAFVKPNNVLGIWHLGTLTPDNQEKKYTSSLYLPDVNGVDCELLLMETEHLCTNGVNIIFSLVDSSSGQTLARIERKFDKDVKVKCSELFPEEKLQNKSVHIEYKAWSKNYMNFCFLINDEYTDGSSIHHSGEEFCIHGNCLKSMFFPKVTDNCKSWLVLLNPMKGRFNYRLKLFLDNGQEYVRVMNEESNLEVLKFEMQELFPDILNQNYGNGLIVMESQDYNVQGDVYTYTKGNDGKETIAVDHLTGA